MTIPESAADPQGQPEHNTDAIDPTRVREQASLTTSSGRSWLLLGGLLAAIGLAILIPMLWLSLPGVALAGIVGVLALYSAMILLRVVVPAGRRRLAFLAAAMIVMAILELGCVGLIAFRETGGGV